MGRVPGGVYSDVFWGYECHYRNVIDGNTQRRGGMVFYFLVGKGRERTRRLQYRTAARVKPMQKATTGGGYYSGVCVPHLCGVEVLGVFPAVLLSVHFGVMGAIIVLRRV